MNFSFFSITAPLKRLLAPGKTSVLAAALLILVPGIAAAQTVITDGNKVIRIEDLPIPDAFGMGGIYDVRFVYDTGNDLYPNESDFTWTSEEEAFGVLELITDTLNTNNPVPTRAGPNGTQQFFIAVEKDNDFSAYAAVGAQIFGTVWDQCEFECLVGTTVLPGSTPYTYAVFQLADSSPPPDPGTGVDLSGNVYTVIAEDPVPLCALVLASGEFVFSCGPNGPYALSNLPREPNGTVTRQVYVDGFYPNIDNLPDSTVENVYMQPSGDCPNYNAPSNPASNPGSAGDRINISGAVLLQDTSTPICALVLANGVFMFTCGGNGEYQLNIPLDGNGQFGLQVYADGFAPEVQVFDESSPVNDVRMARVTECD